MSDLTNQESLLPLSSEEKTALSYHENVIEKGLETFIEVGQSLQYIRDNRLYRAEYKTFDEYMSERWGKTRAWASNMIKAVDTMETLTKMSTRVDSLPESEKVARPLAKLKDDPELMAQVWEEAVAEAKKQFEAGKKKTDQPTHQEVEAKVKEYEAQIEALKKANQSLENTQLSLSQELAKVTVEKSNYETKTKELESQLKAKTDEISNLSKQIKDNETAINELETKKKNLDEREVKLNELIATETDKKVKDKLLEERQAMNEEKQKIANKEYELNQAIENANKLKEEAELLKDETQKQIKSEKEKYDYFQEWICEFSLLNQHFRGGNNTLTKNIRVLRNLPDFSILSDEEKQIRLEDTQEDINNIQSLIDEHINTLTKLRNTLNDVENRLFQSDNVIDIIAV